LSEKKSYWQEDFGEEWINFTDGVPIDLVVENAEPEEVETNWGVATIIKVREYRQGELKGGINKTLWIEFEESNWKYNFLIATFLKQLRINSKRLRRALVNASPGGLPAKGNGYTVTRRGEGWSTTYNVTWLGKYRIEDHGSRRLLTGK
jgi:hypothetical protein